MPKGITRIFDTAENARLAMLINGHTVSMASALGVWVLHSPNAPESTFVSLGLSTQFAAT
jgi:hypothetical protein